MAVNMFTAGSLEKFLQLTESARWVYFLSDPKIHETFIEVCTKVTVISAVIHVAWTFLSESSPGKVSKAENSLGTASTDAAASAGRATDMNFHPA